MKSNSNPTQSSGKNEWWGILKSMDNLGSIVLINNEEMITEHRITCDTSSSYELLCSIEHNNDYPSALLKKIVYGEHSNDIEGHKMKATVINMFDDVVIECMNRIYTFCYIDYQSYLKETKEIEFYRKYTLSTELNNRGIGIVRIVKNKENNELYDLRVMDVHDHMTEDELEKLKLYSDPKIMNMFDLYQSTERIYVISPQGTPLDGINSSIIDENKIKSIITQVMNGLKYLHDHDIAHGHLSLKCIMQDSRDSDMYRIGDWYVRGLIKNNSIKDTMTSNDYFCAPPETRIKKELSPLCVDSKDNIKETEDKVDYKKVDMWGLGCIIYEIETKSKPFTSDAEYESGDFVKSERYEHAEDTLRDLIVKLLKTNPSERLTIKDCLFSEYITTKRSEPM